MTRQTPNHHSPWEHFYNPGHPSACTQTSDHGSSTLQCRKPSSRVLESKRFIVQTRSGVWLANNRRVGSDLKMGCEDILRCHTYSRVINFSYKAVRMSGFLFRGVRPTPAGDFVPDLAMSEIAHARIRERWDAHKFIGPDGTPMTSEQRETELHELVVSDALWQHWLSNDSKEPNGERTWQIMPTDEKLWFLDHCVRDGR